MSEVVAKAGEFSSDFYNYFLSLLPTWAQNFLGLFLLVLLIVVYSIFIWKLHRFISKKNIFALDLHQYNKSEHPTLYKFAGIGFYILEYIIILPALILFWFGIFAIFLILMTKDIPIQTILILSATIVGAIRITSYYNENLSKEIAKLFPLTLLAVAMTESGFFEFSRIFSQFAQLPQFFSHIVTYIIFIVALEVLLRFFEFIFSLFRLTDEETEEEN